jgi:hypothetical protein
VRASIPGGRAIIGQMANVAEPRREIPLEVFAVVWLLVVLVALAFVPVFKCPILTILPEFGANLHDPKAYNGAICQYCAGRGRVSLITRWKNRMYLGYDKPLLEW